MSPTTAFDPPGETRRRAPTAAVLSIGGLLVVVVILVALTLRRPADVPEFEPTPLDAPAASGPGPHQLTLDASDPERWRYLNLERVRVEDPPGRWDLAFRRFEVKVNGGPGFGGQGGLLDLGAVPLDSVTSLPEEGYLGMDVAGRDTTHALLDDWYSYSYTTHVLRPKDRTYAVRTASGRRAALRFVSYYCPGARPGCVTLRWRFVDAPAAGR